MDGGKSVAFYSMELVYCDQAATLLKYDDPNCETNHTLTWETFQKHQMTFDAKFVSQFFNADQYYNEKIMNYLTANQQSFYLHDQPIGYN